MLHSRKMQKAQLENGNKAAGTRARKGFFGNRKKQ